MGALDVAVQNFFPPTLQPASSQRAEGVQCLGWNDSRGSGRCIILTRHVSLLCNFCLRTLSSRPDLAELLPLWWRQEFARTRGVPESSGVALAAGDREVER